MKILMKLKQIAQDQAMNLYNKHKQLAEAVAKDMHDKIHNSIEDQKKKIKDTKKLKQ